MAKSSELRRLEERRETVKMALRTIRSDIANPQRLLNAIQRDKEEIERLLLRIARVTARHDSLDSLHRDAVVSLSALNTKIKAETHSVKIEAMKRLASLLFEEAHNGPDND